MLSCGGETPQEEIIDLEDLIGEVGEMKIDSSDMNNEAVQIGDTDFDHFVFSQLQNYDTAALVDRHLLDRFGYSTNRRIQFVGKENVPYGKNGKATPKADIFYYCFSDSVKTNNAFYNYLDGMAEEGEGGPVKLMQDVDAIKMPPMQMFVYDTVIVSAHYTCEAVSNDWKPFKDSLISKFGSNYRYRFDVKCGGPLVWQK